jgi:transposase
MLGRLYCAAWKQECEMGAQMQSLIGRHPAWSWLRGVRGVGSVLAARLLSRLDLTRAPSPASFWAYCGLGTVAAEELVCEQCGARVFVSPGTRVGAAHTPARCVRAESRKRSAWRRDVRGAANARRTTWKRRRSAI